MNSIIDLNTTANISYNAQSSYAIVYGTNAGNVSLSIDEDQSHALEKRTPLNSITSPVRDVLVDIQFAGYPSNAFPVTDVTYAGNWGNISLAKISTNLWRWSGIRSVAQYNEVFANTVLGNAFNYTSNTYSYSTLVTDQQGNNRSWNTSVTLVDYPTVVVTGTVIYNQDIVANVNNVNIVSVNPSRTYTFTANSAGIGVMGNASGNANVVTLTGNITSLNSQLSGNVLKFYPGHNYASTGNITYELSAPGNTYQTGNITMAVGNTHSNYTPANSITVDEDGIANITGITITDFSTQPLANGAPYTYTVSLTPANGKIFYTGNSSYANSISFTNSKSSINAIFSGNTVRYVPTSDFSGNTTILYTQRSVEDNLLQANANVAVSVTAHTDYTLTTAYTVNEDAVQQLTFQITDQDTSATDYTVAFSESVSTGSRGQFIVNGVPAGLGNNISISNSKANINSANVSWTAYPDQAPGFSTLYYSQYKTDPLFGNITQASSIPITINTGTTFPEYYLSTSNTVPFNQSVDIGGFIRDRDSVYDSYRVRYVQLTPTPTAPTNTVGFNIAGAAGIPGFARTGDTGWVTGNRRDFNNENSSPYLPWAVFYDGSNTYIGNPSRSASIESPIDYVGNITIAYSQEKNVAGTWIPQASNVVVAITQTGNTATYTLNPTGTWSNAVARTLTASIFDDPLNVAFGSAINWDLTMTQLSPDPATYPGQFKLGTANIGPAGGPATQTGVNRSSQQTFSYIGPTGYTGNVVIGYTQIKNQEGNAYIQASNVTITLNKT